MCDANANANANANTNDGVVEVFFQDGGRGWLWWHGTCILLPCVCICVAPINTCEMQM